MSCQDQCLVMDYDEPNDFYREATRKAAKPHRCCECGETIAKGEVHHYAAGKTDGSFWEYRTCAPCAEIRVTFSCSGWMFTALRETIDEQMFPKWNAMTAIDCLARLKTQPAIDKLRTFYADYEDARK